MILDLGPFFWLVSVHIPSSLKLSLAETEAVGPIAKYRLKVLKGINDKVIFPNSSNNFCPFDYVLLPQTEPFFRPCQANEHVYFVS